jgi:hypothetical protein
MRMLGRGGRILWHDALRASKLNAFGTVYEGAGAGVLGQKGILSEAVISEIWRLSSGGLPLLISMMAVGTQTGECSGRPLCGCGRSVFEVGDGWGKAILKDERLCQ